MRVALDTNVIVSAWIRDGPEGEVVTEAYSGAFDLIIPQVVVQELEDVFFRKFAWSRERIEQMLEDFVAVGDVVTTVRRFDVIPGEDADNQIIACAVEHGADYLVTGDRKHLLPLGEFEGVRILRAPEFLVLLRSDD